MIDNNPDEELVFERKMSDLTAVLKNYAASISDELPVRTYPEDRNCLSYWYPRLVGAGIPTPETEIIRTEVRLIEMFDNKEPDGMKHLVAVIDDAATRMGYPCFLRTGQTSAKHNWENGPCLTGYGEIRKSLYAITEYSEIAGFHGLDTSVWCVRKMLPTDPLYRCKRYGNMPVVREFRFFVEDGDIRYTVPYWPMDALRKGDPDDPLWADSYDQQHSWEAMSFGDRSAVEIMVIKASNAVKGQWSVDVLDVGGQWYVTDMAIASMSYGYAPAMFEEGDES